MSAIIEIAAQGNLVVAVGKGAAREVARISSAVIKLASPVLNFKEGQSTFDAPNPLELPDDDPISVLNLFRIFHYKSREVDMAADDWLEELIFLADKYQCVSKLQHYIAFTYETGIFSAQGDVNIFLISGLVGDAERFEERCEDIMQMTEAEVRAGGHPKLLELAPHDMFEKTKVYRLNARAENLEVYHSIITKIYCSDLVQKFEVCYGLQQRINALTKWFYRQKLLFKDLDKDCALPNMRIKLSHAPIFNKDRCGDSYWEPCKSCQLSVGNIIAHVRNNPNLMAAGDTYLCLGCFKKKKFSRRPDCTEHTASEQTGRTPE